MDDVDVKRGSLRRVGVHRENNQCFAVCRQELEADTVITDTVLVTPERDKRDVFLLSCPKTRTLAAYCTMAVAVATLCKFIKGGV